MAINEHRAATGHDPLRPDEQESLTGSVERYAPVVSWLVIAAGVLIRFYHFIGGRDFWVDEAMIALNIRHLTRGELFGHLDYDQLAPIGWLQLEKTLDQLTGVPEYDLRLAGLLAAIAGMVAFRLLAPRFLGWPGALAAIVILAFSPPGIAQAVEVKPYTFDLLFSVTILALGCYILVSRHRSWPALLVLSALGIVSGFFSFPTVYILAAVGAVLMARSLYDRRYSEVSALAVMGLSWVVCYITLYLLIYNQQSTGTTLTTGSAAQFFDRVGYAPFPPRSLSEIVWYARWGKDLVWYLFDDARLLACIFVVLGGWSICRRNSWLAAMITLPLVIALVGSGLKLYPLWDRLTLFLLPSLLILLGEGFGWLYRRAPAGAPAWTILVAATAGTGLLAINERFSVWPPFKHQSVTPLMGTIKREYQPRDRIYVGRTSLPQYIWYARQQGLIGIPFIYGSSEGTKWPCLIDEIAPSRPERVWVIVSFSEPSPPTDAIAWTLGARGLTGSAEPKGETEDAWLYLLSVRPNREALDQSNWPRTALDCKWKPLRGPRVEERVFQ